MCHFIVMMIVNGNEDGLTYLQYVQLLRQPVLMGMISIKRFFRIFGKSSFAPPSFRFLNNKDIDAMINRDRSENDLKDRDRPFLSGFIFDPFFGKQSHFVSVQSLSCH